MRRIMPLRSSHSLKASSALVICVSWSMSAPTMKVDLAEVMTRPLRLLSVSSCSTRPVEHVHRAARHVDGDETNAVGVDFQAECGGIGLRLSHDCASRIRRVR
jgi:hypothetical protein